MIAGEYVASGNLIDRNHRLHDKIHRYCGTLIVGCRYHCWEHLINLIFLQKRYPF